MQLRFDLLSESEIGDGIIAPSLFLLLREFEIAYIPAAFIKFFSGKCASNPCPSSYIMIEVLNLWLNARDYLDTARTSTYDGDLLTLLEMSDSR